MRLEYLYPKQLDLSENITIKNEVTYSFLRFVAKEDVAINNDDILVGYKGTHINSIIMTHKSDIKRVSLPFAFPALVVRTSENEGLSIVVDYYKTSIPLRVLTNNSNNNGWFGVCSNECKLRKGDYLELSIYYGKKSVSSMFELIGNSAKIMLENVNYWENDLNKFGGQFVSSYNEASLGLVSNLMDYRAIIHDGTGTFNPYGYHENDPYSESFACMDVSKGLYRFALSNKLDGPLDYIKNAIYNLCDQNKEHPWITHAHNTDGFFHFAWGAIPQDSGVKADIERADLFSDFCGHEEGPNLLSTFKYFDRVNLLGEMAILEKDQIIVDGFKRTLPFLESLRNDDYTQPVSYDLDSHIPVTGNFDGGSGGAEALYALIELNAYRLFGGKDKLDNALKSIDALNKLDYDHMFSMRCAPKPIAVGACVRANVYAYEITKEEKYLEYAKKISQGIYATYYLGPHPYCYFSTIGFGYACCAERWEAFREMEETLWLASPYLRYSNDENLFKLYLFSRQSTICSLPINGNPRGNLAREYESFGGEYIPFEFSTGHIGDNPCLEGGSQSDQRQIKEIYGCGELFLAGMLYENYAKSYSPKIIITCVNCDVCLPTNYYEFKVYNPLEKDNVIFDFYLEDGNYELDYNGKVEVFSSKELSNGLLLPVNNGISHLSLNKVDIKKELLIQRNNLDVIVSRSLDRVDISFIKDDSLFYIIKDTNDIGEKCYKTINNFITIKIDSEIDHSIKVYGISNGKISEYNLVIIKAIKRDFAYRLNYDNLKVYNNDFSLINDKSVLSFYRKDLNTCHGIVTFDLGYLNVCDAFFEMNIGSINNGMNYDIDLVCNNNIISICKNEKSSNYFVKNISLNGDTKLIINTKTNAGLGFSITRLDVCYQKESETAIVPLMKEEKGYKSILTQGYKYAVILVENIKYKDCFDVFVDNKIAYNEQEKQFFGKVNRSNRGAYIIPIDCAKEIKVVSNHGTVELKCIRLTQLDDYPVLTEYISKDEVRYFYGNK